MCLLQLRNADKKELELLHYFQRSNLSHSRLEKFVSNLTGAGLVNKIEYDGKNTFVITEKGRLFLEEYTKFHEFATSLRDWRCKIMEGWIKLGYVQFPGSSGEKKTQRS